MPQPLGSTHCLLDSTCGTYTGASPEGTTYRFQTFCDDTNHHEVPWETQCRFGHGQHDVAGVSIDYGQQSPRDCSSYDAKCMILGHALSEDGSDASVTSQNCPAGDCYTVAHAVTSLFLYREGADGIYACEADSTHSCTGTEFALTIH